MRANTPFKLNGGSSEVFRGAIYLPTGAVTVTSDRELDPEAVRAAVDEAGYAVAS